MDIPYVKYVLHEQHGQSHVDVGSLDRGLHLSFAPVDSLGEPHFGRDSR